MHACMHIARQPLSRTDLCLCCPQLRVALLQPALQLSHLAREGIHFHDVGGVVDARHLLQLTTARETCQGLRPEYSE